MIKISSVTVSLLMLFVSSLEARLNPFEPTKTYLEEKEVLLNTPVEIKQEPIVKKKKIEIPKDIIKKVEPIVVKKEDITPPVKEKKPAEEIILKEPIKIVVADLNTTKVVVKPREIKTYKYNLLSFVDMHITDDIMNIQTKYKLKQHFTLVEENKLVFDYIGKKRFYTKRETLSSHKDFKKIIIGAHPEDYYFRIVIQTQEKVSKYKVTISKNGLVTIVKTIRK